MALVELVRRLKAAGAHLVVYTGNIYEALAQNSTVLAYIDILVDGSYIIEQDSPEMQDRDSRNQCRSHRTVQCLPMPY